MADAEYCFIVNPAAGGGHAGARWPELAARLRESGIAFDCLLSEQRGHGVELARQALAAGHRRLVAVGGDGTANEILNGMFADGCAPNPEVQLGIVPWGTGNDWASYYGLPGTADAWLDLLRSGQYCGQDIGRAVFPQGRDGPREHYFLNCAGTGFDSFLLRSMGSPDGKRLRYLWSVLTLLRRFRAARLHLELDSDKLAVRALMLEVCLGRSVGAGMRLAPGARANDGSFEVLLIEDLSLPRLLASLPYLYNGRIREHPSVRSWSSPVIKLSADAEQFLQCDGELVDRLPVSIELLPRALQVIAPAPAA
jgi:YegS/Rv2252/BmrU family lipid kinase